MKPLVYWCRWHEARLQLHGRGETTVWGNLLFNDGRSEPFQFNLQTWQLTLGVADNVRQADDVRQADNVRQADDVRQIQLDEKGVAVY
jgi:hypothetical protein